MKRMPMMQEPRFQNLTEQMLTLDDVRKRILCFIEREPASAYDFIIGTDSQVHRGYTKFVTGIIIHRLGKGAWACYRSVVVSRELTSIREKLDLETALSQETACQFCEAVRQMEDLLLPFVYKGAGLRTFIDIDAGTEPVVNRTSLYVQEMVDRVEAMGTYAPRVKPDAYGASSYANRYTKRPINAAVSYR